MTLYTAATSNQPEMSDDTKDHTTDPIKENASSATDGCEKSKLKGTLCHTYLLAIEFLKGGVT